jgi:hypothetical protein
VGAIGFKPNEDMRSILICAYAAGHVRMYARKGGSCGMINLTINKIPVQVSEGTTILEAAESIGIRIPTLCYIKEISPLTSCMLCVVRIEEEKILSPPVQQGQKRAWWCIVMILL